MGEKKSEAQKKPRKKSSPALTPKQREDQLVALAYDRTEEVLRDPNAKISSQLLVHLLKRGTIEAELELEKLKKENALLEAKKEAYDSAVRSEELYSKAIEQMKKYRGEE